MMLSIRGLTRALAAGSVGLLAAGCLGWQVMDGSLGPSAATGVARPPSVDASGPPPSRAAGKVAPVQLSIPAIDILADIVPVTTTNRVLQIPPEPWVVGWWSGGAGPGTGTGAVVLAAHLDSRTYGLGPFARAAELAAGAEARLTDARGTQHSYKVDTVQMYEKGRLPYNRLFSQTGTEKVVLVTCGGTYNPDNGGYESNLVVTLVPSTVR